MDIGYFRGGGGVDILTPDSIRMWHVWPIRAIGINSMVSTTVLVQQG